MTEFIDPPFEQWRSIAAQYSSSMASFPLASISPGATSVSQISQFQRVTSHILRNILIKLGTQYTEELLSIANERGIELPAPSITSLKDDTRGKTERIVMSGHQPVVYHPGLLLKEENLELFAEQNNYLPIHIVIDTDEGDGGALLYPEVLPLSANDAQRSLNIREGRYASVHKRSISIANGIGLYLHQKVAEREVVQEAFLRVENSLISLQMEEQLKVLIQVKALYERLSGVPIAVANSVVRWALRGRKHLEVPFSRFLKVPEVQSLLLDWIKGGRDFAHSYNHVLEQFRIERKIKNPANPFPNMGVREGSAELPFWIIDSSKGERRPCITPLEVSLSGTTTSFIAPRGSITTLLLRGFCSDLFIHGKGGAKYDPFVDRLAESVLKIWLAPFVVASQDMRLFPAPYAEYLSAEELKVQYKEMVSHTEKFLGVGLFSENESHSLRAKVEERKEALKSLQLATDPTSKSTAAHRLNGVNRAIKEILDTSSMQQKLQILNTDPEIVATWSCREYPFFLSLKNEPFKN